MPTSLPYLAAPGSILTALQRIRSAATPDRVTIDFVTTILNIKGGTGSAIPPFLKKMNFVASDGVPTELYRSFRNPSTGGRAVAEAIKICYHPLLEANEYFYQLGDSELTALIVQVTGLDFDNKIVRLVLATIANLKTLANFSSNEASASAVVDNVEADVPKDKVSKNNTPSYTESSGLNLTYTINLNLPSTSDQAVFNAIFKSLKEHLLSHE